MSFPRASGILLHPTSLPGCFAIGDLGPAAFAFADFLAAGGQSLWQVLPLGPTGYGDSPYACYSAFAGNTLLLVRRGLLRKTCSIRQIQNPRSSPLPTSSTTAQFTKVKNSFSAVLIKTTEKPQTRTSAARSNRSRNAKRTGWTIPPSSAG